MIKTPKISNFYENALQFQRMCSIIFNGSVQFYRTEKII